MTGMRFSSTQVRTVSRTARSSSERRLSKFRKSTPANWDVGAAVAISSSGMVGWSVQGGKIASRPTPRQHRSRCTPSVPLARCLGGQDLCTSALQPGPHVPGRQHSALVLRRRFAAAADAVTCSAGGGYAAWHVGRTRPQGRVTVKILLLSPQPFFQARGTPIAVRLVLEFLSSRGHQVDVLTYHEGSDVEIPNCRIVRIPRLPGIRNIRPGFSLKKVLCDLVMFFGCARMMHRTRYDLVHAVEESAFIAAALQPFTGVPYVYDMDSSLAEQMIDTYPGLALVGPILRWCEGLAVRRSAGVLTVCATLQDIARGHAPGTPVGRVEDTTLLAPGERANGAKHLPPET